MKRNEILLRLGYGFKQEERKRVIICTDAKNEADDQYAIMQHLLTPSEEIIGIVACHFERISEMMTERLRAKGVEEVNIDNVIRHYGWYPVGTTMQASYDEIIKILQLAEIDDVKVFKGATGKMDKCACSEGSKLIVEESKKGKLYVCCLGTLTDLALALKCDGVKAENITCVWIGGGAYPKGGEEYNVSQDIEAANEVFSNKAEVWQIPINAYSTVMTSVQELYNKIYNCGKIGEYLYKQLVSFMEHNRKMNPGEPARESWILGDNPSATVLACNDFGMGSHEEAAPVINSDYTYGSRNKDKKIKVYDNVYPTFILSDFYAKMKSCYGQNK